MQLKTLTNQTIALVGIAQAAALVQQLATTGKADTVALEASIGSLLKIDSDSVLDIYGGLANLKLGLDQLNTQMTGYKIADSQQARYCASLVFLENRLAKEPKMLNTIQIGIVKAQAQADQFGLLHENVFANLGDIYQSTLSNLQPRVMVNGNPDYLSRADIANKIRACLLAGIRSALLWRQCGGTRWKFLFYRRKMQLELEQLLKQVS
ncbi:MAG: high frequency lysogenization protein HflD [Methylococcaceae bacterium]|nr:high frequency lysogenization protein HflD [Methylococcaceae bacterium]MDD1607386.1 high frequency lysogenization protein HflD [Methylococcaceae bacterium]MDD1616791.1 high frequency lysogenization protein HflD [Methylococcaceae bacterium]OYV16851.1 MAG: high frequency lysogenization protein [Methylococcaceae bacterium NSP1-2]